MSGYWYFDGTDGRRFCYAKEPTFVCPLTQIKVSTADEHWEVPEAFTRAAELLGVYPDSLVRLVVRGHRNNRRARVNGRLTDRCDNCGHAMDRLGFRCWVEVDSRRSDAGAQITRAMGGTPTDILKAFYLDTKKEAREWAREQAAVAKHIKESDR